MLHSEHETRRVNSVSCKSWCNRGHCIYRPLSLFFGVMEEHAFCIIDEGSGSLVCMVVKSVPLCWKCGSSPLLTINTATLLGQGKDFLKSFKSNFVESRLGALPAGCKCELSFFHTCLLVLYRELLEFSLSYLKLFSHLFAPVKIWGWGECFPLLSVYNCSALTLWVAF